MTNANLGPAGWALPSQVPFPPPWGPDVAGRVLDPISFRIFHSLL